VRKGRFWLPLSKSTWGRGKGNNRRPSGLISPTNINLWRDLQKAHTSRKTDYVIEYRGKPIKSVDLSDAFERANIPEAKRTQHVLKHTCCSWLVQAGREYGEIAKLVGTTAATIEKFYGHLSPKQMAAVGDVLSV
jgi:integrase